MQRQNMNTEEKKSKIYLKNKQKRVVKKKNILKYSVTTKEKYEITSSSLKKDVKETWQE